jgi:predicted nuclease of predicted toxin-antitoxin system
MRFFADHCVPRSIGDTLESEGHEVIRLAPRPRVDAEDSAVIEEAQMSGAKLLSLNGDFADLFGIRRRSMEALLRSR